MKLVVSPLPMPTESLIGYILRLTELNGYPSKSYVLELMGRNGFRATIERLDAECLANVTSINQLDIDRLTYKLTELPPAYIRIYGTDLPSYEVSLNRPKVCSLCLNEGRPCEVFWELAQATVCPIHRVNLTTLCSGCGKHISWSRAKVRQCKCGSDFAIQNVKQAIPELCDLMAVMRCLVYKDPNIAPFPKSMTHLAHLDLRRFCKLLNVMCSVFHNKVGSFRAMKRTNFKSHLEDVSKALSNWPFGFHKFLTEKYASYIESVHELPNFRTLFKWLLVRLIDNDKNDVGAYTFLVIELYKFGANYWNRCAMSRSFGMQELMPVKSRWLTHGEVSGIYGLHLSTIKKRILKGEFKTRKIKISNRKLLVIDSSLISDLPLTKYPAASLRTYAHIVGVTVNILRAMRICGAIELNYRSMYPKSLTREDMDAFVQKIHSLGLEMQPDLTSGVITINDVFIAWVSSPKEKAEFLAYLLENPALIVGKIPGDGLGCFQVVEKVAINHFNRIKSENSVFITTTKVAKRLGCTEDIVRFLLRDGHFRTLKYRGRDTPCLASVIEFERYYLPIARIADQMGISFRQVYLRLEFNKVDHLIVKGPRFKTIFIARNNIPKVKRMLKA